MNKGKVVLFVIAAMILPIIGLTQQVHAAGQVYINPGVTGNQIVGNTFQVQVKVANINPFNTYDVQVVSDPSVITATSLSVSGNILLANATTPGTPFELVHCVNGLGQGCVQQKDGPGIVHSEFTDAGFGVNASGSGLLFTITYQVVSGKSYSPIAIQNDVIAIGGTVVVHTTTSGAYGFLCQDNTNASCLNPSFIQANWRHRLSLSKDQGVQTWKFGLHNPNNDTVYVSVFISGIDNTGTNGFSTSSSVIALAPNTDLTNQILSQAFPPGDIGTTFSFSMVISWGTSAASQPNTSTDSAFGVPTSGSFTVLA